MPNGGSDCCGHRCGFFENKASDAHLRPSRRNGRCSLRDCQIEYPMATYCVNHPFNNVLQTTIPVGRVYGSEMQRRPITSFEDNPQLREDLLRLLESLEVRTGHTYMPGWFQRELLEHLIALDDKGAAPFLRRYF